MILSLMNPHQTVHLGKYGWCLIRTRGFSDPPDATIVFVVFTCLLTKDTINKNQCCQQVLTIFRQTSTEKPPETR